MAPINPQTQNITDVAGKIVEIAISTNFNINVTSIITNGNTDTNSVAR